MVERSDALNLKQVPARFRNIVVVDYFNPVEFARP